MTPSSLPSARPRGRCICLGACVALALLALARPAFSEPAAAPRSAARLDFSPSTLKFAAPGERKTLVITNRGSAATTVTVKPSAGSERFFEASGEISSSLGPGASAKIEVVWRTPARSHGEAQAFGGLTITSADPRGTLDPAVPDGRVLNVGLEGAASGILLWIVFFPLLGIPIVLLVPRTREEGARWVALAVSVVPLLLTLVMLQRFDSSISADGGRDALLGAQMVFHRPWLTTLGVELFFGVDGTSVLMVLLTTLVSVIAVGASWSVKKHIRGYLALFLLLEVGMAGTFVALDFFLFYVFWEVMLLPMYFLVGIWGGPRKEYAAIKFFLYTLFGSVLMLVALVAIYYATPGGLLVDGTPSPHSFDLLRMAHEHADRFVNSPLVLGLPFAKVMFVLLFVGFAVKVPVVPLHTWLPDAHVEAPTAISVILAGVLLKMGIYGMLRINFPLLPEATRWAAPGLAFFGVLGMIYGALCAMAQSDLKRLVAYSSVSHMGYCLLGIAGLSQTGVSGAILQLFNHGTITSMLFLLVGVLYDRAHVRDLDAFGGLARELPRQALLFGLAFMASLGLPGLSGFVGEALVFLGAFPAYPVMVGIGALGLVLTAAYHLWAIQRIQLGPFNEARWGEGEHRLRGRDLTLREALMLVPLALIVIALGVYPMPALSLIGHGVSDFLQLVARTGVAEVAGLLP